MNFFDADQKIIVSYINKSNTKRVIFDTIENIYKFFVNNKIQSFYYIDNAMDWRHATSIQCENTNNADKRIKITTNMGHVILLSSRNRHSSNIANLNVNSILPKKASLYLPGDTEYINNHKQTSMDSDLHYSYRRPMVLGYNDGMILGGFTNLRGSIDGMMGKMRFVFERDYDLSRKNKIVDNARLIMNIYEPNENHEYSDETDNSTNLTYISFKSQRIAEMILKYYNKDIGDMIDFINDDDLTTVKDIVGIMDDGKGVPLYIRKYIELAKDKEINPNGHEANDPIIRRELDEAYNRWLHNRESESYDKLDEIKFNYINLNVLLESKEFREGIINGFLDSSPLTLHINCLNKDLADEIEMIATSIGYRTARSEYITQPLEYNILIQDIMIDKLSSANYLIESKTEENVDTEKDKIYGINADEENTLITLPCGIVAKL